MNMKSASPQQQNQGEWIQKHLGSQQDVQAVRWLRWWYQLTTPPTPPLTASFAERDSARRGRLASTILFVVLIILTFAIPIGLLARNSGITIPLLVLLVVTLVALFFTKRGQSNVAGLLLVVCVNAALIVIIRSTPSGELSNNGLVNFDLLVIVEVLVASLLPPNWIFPALLFNVSFIVWDINFQPWSDDLRRTFENGKGYNVYMRPIFLHLIVSVVLWLWVRGANQALARADRAEVIAQLEHTLAIQEHEVAQQKRLLDNSIQQIIDTHVRVANGDYEARVPLTNENVLWPIAGALNNLVSRLQRLRQFEYDMQHALPEQQRMRQEMGQIKGEIARLAASLRRARLSNSPLQLAQTNTDLDHVIIELNQLSQPVKAQRLISPFENGSITTKNDV